MPHRVEGSWIGWLEELKIVGTYLWFNENKNDYDLRKTCVYSKSKFIQQEYNALFDRIERLSSIMKYFNEMVNSDKILSSTENTNLCWKSELPRSVRKMNDNTRLHIAKYKQDKILLSDIENLVHSTYTLDFIDHPFISLWYFLNQKHDTNYEVTKRWFCLRMQEICLRHLITCLF